MPKTPRPGCVYLIHFDRPLAHARHYLGYTKNATPGKRLAKHARGEGARLMRVIRDAGITWQLARVWKKATRTDERRLKNWNGSARLCPICKAAKKSGIILDTPAGSPILLLPGRAPGFKTGRQT